MSRNTVNSKPVNAAVNDEIRDLIAAMPIVIFVKALRAAFHRPAAVRATLRTS